MNTITWGWPKILVVLIGTTAVVTTLGIASAQGLPGIPGIPGLGDSGRTATLSSDEIDGVAVEVTRVAADDTGLIVSVRVVGRPELGNAASPIDAPYLIAPDGSHQAIRMGKRDPADRRTMTFIFHPTSVTEGDFTFVMDGLEFVEQQGAIRSGDVTAIDNDWMVPITVEAPVRAATTVEIATELELGATRVTIESATFGEVGLVVRGTLTGIAPDRVPDIKLEASLDGQTPLILTWGLGEARDGIEMTFASAPDGPANLRISIAPLQAAIGRVGIEPASASTEIRFD